MWWMQHKASRRGAGYVKPYLCGKRMQRQKQHKSTCRVVWVRRCHNEEADSMSRFAAWFDKEDCAMSTQECTRVQRLANCQPTHDVFASELNHKCEKCTATWRDAKATRVDSTANHPTEEAIWAFPPRMCVMQFLKNMARHLQGGNAQTVLLMVPTRMDAQTKAMLQGRRGYRKGVQRVCKLPRDAVQLGPMGKPRWAQDQRHTFEVHETSKGFTSDEKESWLDSS